MTQKPHTDKDEAKLEQLAKSLFKLKPKPRQDMTEKGKGSKDAPRKRESRKESK